MKNTFQIDKTYFIKVCNSSKTMAEAARILHLKYKILIKYAKLYGCYNPNQGGKGTTKSYKNTLKKVNDILSGKFPNFQTYKLKQKLIKLGIKQNKCEICGCKDWQGKPLQMQLHHIDGNPKNHLLNNLQMLCPNCHSQTENFTARNKRH